MPVCQYLHQVPLDVHEEADPLPRSEGGLAEEEESTHVQAGYTLTAVHRDQLQHCCPLHPPGPFTTISVAHFIQNILAKEGRVFLPKLCFLCSWFLWGKMRFLPTVWRDKYIFWKLPSTNLQWWYCEGSVLIAEKNITSHSSSLWNYFQLYLKKIEDYMEKADSTICCSHGAFKSHIWFYKNKTPRRCNNFIILLISLSWLQLYYIYQSLIMQVFFAISSRRPVKKQLLSKHPIALLL